MTTSPLPDPPRTQRSPARQPPSGAPVGSVLRLLEAGPGVPRCTRGDAAVASPRTDWVLAAPFRAHVRAILCATGLPWRALALLAGVPPQVVRSLVFGTPAGPLRRLRAVDAELLLQVDSPGVLRLARMPVRPDAVAARIGLLRRLTAGDDPRIAGWLHLSVDQLDSLAAGRGWCSCLTLLLAAAALSAHGVDGFWALQHLEGRPLLPELANPTPRGRHEPAESVPEADSPGPLPSDADLLTHCAA